MHIKIKESDKVLSAHGGLILFKTLADNLNVRRILEPHLPRLVSGSVRGWHKLQGLMNGFVAGAECLEDMDRLAEDDAFVATLDGRAYSSKSYGNFLRDFTTMDCKHLTGGLVAQAYRLRDELNKPDRRSITFDFDSTSNQQYAKKMEGVAANYNGLDCLDTFQVFDELGIQYWNDVRPGNTFSANGVGEVIHTILSRMPKEAKFKRLRRYSRADSAFCNSEYFNGCMAKDVGFVTSMRQNMLLPLMSQITHWEPTNPKKETRVKFYDGRECEVAETIYRHDDVPRLLRVVVIRAPKPESGPVLFKQEADYDYRGWVTSIGEHEMSSENLIRFYRRRGHAENFIRELKYGFDLKHYPCLKLLANKAYGLIAAAAYNLMRFIALKDCEETPHFAKSIRCRLVHLPVQVVRHAGEVVFHFGQRHFKEVQYWIAKLRNIQFGFA